MEETIKAIILGVIQGFTEFLPVSSSGHLLLARKLFGLSEAGLFLDTMLHIGTLLAVIVIFWHDLIGMIKKPFSKLTLLVVAGTIPAVIFGFLFKDFFEELAVSGRTVGWEFLVTGIVLWLVDKIKDRGIKEIPEITYGDALIVGTMQAAAMMPAISRSGFTIAGALFQGIDRKAAARFSFLLSVPAILGAIVLQGVDLFMGNTGIAIGIWPLVAGTIAAMVTGYIAVKWMIKIIQRGTLKGFAIYVWILGIVTLVLQFTGKF